MSDEVTPAPAKRGVAKAVYNWTSNTCQIQFHDGQQLTVDPKVYPDQIRKQAEVFGLVNKIQNGYSSNTGVKDAAFKAFAVDKAMKAGDWTVRSSVASNLSEAVARMRGIEMEDAIEFVNGLHADKRKALEKHPQVKAMLAQIAAEKAEKAASETTDELDWNAI